MIETGITEYNDALVARWEFPEMEKHQTGVYLLFYVQTGPGMSPFSLCFLSVFLSLTLFFIWLPIKNSPPQRRIRGRWSPLL